MAVLRITFEGTNNTAAATQGVAQGLQQVMASAQQAQAGVASSAEAMQSAQSGVAQSAQAAGSAAADMGVRFDEASGRWRTASGEIATGGQIVAVGIGQASEAADVASMTLREAGDAAETAGRKASDAAGFWTELSRAFRDIANGGAATGLEQVGTAQRTATAGGQTLAEAQTEVAQTAQVAGDRAAAMGLKFDQASGRWRTATGQFANGAQLAEAGLQKTGQAADQAGDKVKKAGDQAQAAGSQASSSAGMWGQLSGAFASIGPMLTGAVAVIGGAGVALGGLGVSLNAASEQTAVAFQTLLGSGERAKVFLDELRTFSAATPFEFPELAGAAQKLLAFGFQAENILPLMTSIGDAVGALGGSAADVDRVVMAFGQIEAKGKASNEELLQMAELGLPAFKVLADGLGVTVPKLQDMLSKGLVPAAQALPLLQKGFAETFGGSMQAQSATFNGLLSTLKDNASLALQAFTGPLFTQAKSALDALGRAVSSPQFQQFAAQMGTLVGGAISSLVNALRPAAALVEVLTRTLTAGGSAGDAFVAALNRIIPGLGTLAGQVGQWGASIGRIFGDGLASALGYISSVVQQIGAVIASWLRPNSPPKILPEIDQWGTEAAQLYADGFGLADPGPGMDELRAALTEGLVSVGEAVGVAAAEAGAQITGGLFDSFNSADFDLFDKISSGLKTALKAVQDAGGIQKQDLIPRLLGGREAIGQAIREMQQFGSVSQSTFSRISSAAGPLAPQVGALVKAYSDLRRASDEAARAQADLVRITAEYDERLRPLNDKLKAIQDEKQAIEDQERLRDLQQQIAEGGLDDLGRRKAELEIQEIQARQQIEAVEDEKDAATDAAQERLKAAQTAQAAAQEQVDQAQAQLDLVAEQNGLLKEQADLLKQIAEQSKAGGGGAGAGGGVSLGGMPQPFENMPPLDLSGPINTAIEDAKASIAQSLQDLFPDPRPSIEAFIGRAAEDITNGLPRFVGVLGGWTAAAIQWVADALPGLGDKLGELYNKLYNWVLDSLPGWGAELAKLRDQASQWVTDAMPELGAKLGEFTGKLLGWVIQTVIDIAPKLVELGVKFVSWVATDVIPKLPGELAAIYETVFKFIGGVIEGIRPKIEELAGKFTSWVETEVIPKLPGAMQKIQGGIEDWLKSSAEWAKSALGGLAGDLVAGLITELENKIKAVAAVGRAIAAAFLGAANDEAKVNSPSRETMKLGGFLGEGLVLGALATVNAVRDAGTALAQAFSAALSTASEEARKALAEAMHGAADALRERAGGESFVRSLLGDSKDITEQQQQLDRLAARAQALRERLKGADDPKEQMELQRELEGIEQQRAEAAQKLADAQAQQDAKARVAAEAQAKLAKSIEAAQMMDPAAAAEFLQMRRRAIEEQARLQLDLLKADSDEARASIQREIELNRAANDLDLRRFYAELQQPAQGQPGGNLGGLLGQVLGAAGAPGGVLGPGPVLGPVLGPGPVQPAQTLGAGGRGEQPREMVVRVVVDDRNSLLKGLIRAEVEDYSKGRSAWSDLRSRNGGV